MSRHEPQYLVARRPVDEVGALGKTDPEIARQAHEGHQRVDRDQREAHPALARKLHDAGPVAGRLGQQVGPIGRHRCRRVDRQRPLPALEPVGRVRDPQRLRGQRGKIVVPPDAVEGHQQPGPRHLAHVGVVDHHQVIAIGHLLDGPVGEGLERPFLPPDRHAGVGAGPGLGRGDHRVEATCVVPGHAKQLSHGVSSPPARHRRRP